MEEDKVSIIMPAYNVGRYMAESIESVIDQTYKNWQLIIVDDGSSDDTRSIVRQLMTTDSRIQYHWQANGKQGRARNLAIDRASGKYIALFDADDVWIDSKLETQLLMMAMSNADVVFGNAYLIKDGRKTREQMGLGEGTYVGDSALQFLLEPGALIVSSVLVRTDAVRDVGGFAVDDSIQYCEDWHFWLKLALAGKSFCHQSDVLTYYRIHPTSAAQIERDAITKFYFALLDLYRANPANGRIKDEVRRRALEVVYHKHNLTNEVVSSIVEFATGNNLSTMPAWFHQFVFRVNASLFRKSFPFFIANRRKLI